MALTCSELQKVVSKMDRIWLDNQTKMDYVPNIGVLEALRKEQTARMAEIENPDKDKTLRVWWLKQCGLVAGDLADDPNLCDFTGDQAASACVDYALNIAITTKFSIEDTVFRTNEASAQDALAINLLAALKEMDELLAAKAVAYLNTFAGVNQYEGIGDVDGVVTYIAPNYWGADIYGYFGMVKTVNKFSNPFMIHGSNLYMTNWNASYNMANANQKDAAPKLQSIRSYWDLFNIDAINVGELASYMVDKGAVAFANKARYPLNNPKVYQFGQRWSIESQALPGVFYDVYYKERCVSEDEVYHDYKLVGRAGLYNNPNGCNADKTGVIKFVCGVNAGS